MYEWLNTIPVVWRVFTLMGIGTFLFAVYNVSTKSIFNKHQGLKNREAALTVLVMGCTSVILFVLCAFTGGPDIHGGFILAVVATGVLNIVIQFANMRSKVLADVSLVSPISSTTPAIVILTSFVILGEFPTVIGWIGIWVLALGTYALSLTDWWNQLAEQTSVQYRSTLGRWVALWFAPFLALTSNMGVRWALVSALVGSVSLNYDGVVARTAHIAFGAGCVFGITALGNLPLALAQRQFAGFPLRPSIKHVVWLALLFALMHLAMNPAYRETIVPYIGTLKRLSIPMTILLAYLLIGEKKNFWGRLVGGTIMTIGATLIAFGMQETVPPETLAHK